MRLFAKVFVSQITLVLMSTLASASMFPITSGARCESLFAVSTILSSGNASSRFHLESADAPGLFRRILTKIHNRGFSGLENVKNQPILSIVIPAYREELRLPRSIDILREFMDRYHLNYEVIVMVERSPDNSYEAAVRAVAGEPRISVYQTSDGRGLPVQGGKGFAVKMGMMRATGRYRLFMDADLSFSLINVLRFLDSMIVADPLSEFAPQVLVASRTDDTGGVPDRSALRSAMTYSMQTLTGVLGRPAEVTQTQSGFKMFTEDAAMFLFPQQRENGFAFDVELLQMATHFGFSIREQPANWIDAPGSTVNPIRDSAKMLRAMLRIRRDTAATNRNLRRDSN